MCPLFFTTTGKQFKMSVEKIFLPTIKLYSPEDLSKDWFLFYIWNRKRVKRKAGINIHQTFSERMAAALALREQWKKEIAAEKPISYKMIDWLEKHKPKWRRKTYQGMKSKVDCFLRFVNRKRIDEKIVSDFFVDLISRRHATTHNCYRRHLGRIFREIGHGELIEKIDKIKSNSTPAKYFQRHQIIRIKNRLIEQDYQLWMFCQFVYYCFIRPGELRMIRVGDIHFDEWKICVRAGISKNKKQQYVTIPFAFRPELENLKRRSPNEYIFFNLDATKPVGMNYMTRRFRKVISELGFGLEYQMYSWKHTGAVAAVRAGVGLKELQIQLRHHSLDEVNKYLRQLGVWDLANLEERFPAI